MGILTSSLCWWKSPKLHCNSVFRLFFFICIWKQFFIFLLCVQHYCFNFLPLFQSHLLGSSKTCSIFQHRKEFNLIFQVTYVFSWWWLYNTQWRESLGPISDVSYFVDHPLGHISSASKLSVSAEHRARQSHGESQKCCMGTYFYQTTRYCCIHSYTLRNLHESTNVIHNHIF